MAEDNGFDEDLIAELLALNMAVTQLLQTVSELSDDPEAWRHQQVALGEDRLYQTRLWSIPAERRAAVYENAQARFRDIMLSSRPPPDTGRDGA